MSVSILILTYNEERNLPECLDSVQWSDDIVVLDSFSTDLTRDICKRRRVRFYLRPFDDYSHQRNWAIEHIPFRYPWVFSLDADERITPALRDEIIAVAGSAPAEVSAYRVRFKNIFMGKWLRFSSLYPTWVIRLFRPERVRYEERLVNAHPVVKGEIGSLREHFLHYSFASGLERWFEKHNRYSTMEAVECLKEFRRGGLDIMALFSRDPARRRRSAKNIFIRLPARGTLRFIYMYLIRLGFLDGLPGFYYCQLCAIYEKMISLKIKELKGNWDNASVPIRA